MKQKLVIPRKEEVLGIIIRKKEAQDNKDYDDLLVHVITSLNHGEVHFKFRQVSSSVLKRVNTAIAEEHWEVIQPSLFESIGGSVRYYIYYCESSKVLLNEESI